MTQVAADVGTIVLGLCALGTAIGAALWWLWSRAKASGREQAKLEAEQRAQAQAEEELRERMAELEKELQRLKVRQPHRAAADRSGRGGSTRKQART
jgi:Flp pilus assembly protein TadB